MGVGLDYNENLMTALAANGGGNYYFIESSRHLASILGREFDRLGCVAAQTAVIELRTGRGVALVDVVGAEFTDADGLIRIPVGDLYEGDTREFTLEITVPPGRGSLVVAEGVVRYDPAGGVTCPKFLHGPGSFSSSSDSISFKYSNTFSASSSSSRLRANPTWTMT